MNLDVSKPATPTMDATITMDLSSFGNSLNSSDLLNDPYSVINQLNSTFPGITPVTNDISEPSGNNDDGGDSLYEKQYTTLTSRTIFQTAAPAPLLQQVQKFVTTSCGRYYKVGNWEDWLTI